MEYIYQTENFYLEVPEKPFVSREEGGHIVLRTKLTISDRTKLTLAQALEYTRFSMILGEALKTAMARRGVEIGIVNYQEMGNWSVFKPGGPVMHMHIFGRATSATKQKYGEAVKLPFRDTGYYEEFKPLDDEDVRELIEEVKLLSNSPKYS